MNIEVYYDEQADAWLCPYGTVGEPQSAAHWPMTTMSNNGGSRARHCVHLLDAAAPPHCCLFGIAAVARLSSFPYVYAGQCWPAIVSRHDDVVCMAFDVLGPTEGCHRRPDGPPVFHWRYRMHPLRWAGEDAVSDTCVLGVWAD